MAFDYLNDKLIVLSVPRSRDGGRATQHLHIFSTVDAEIVQKIQFSYSSYARAKGSSRSTAARGECFSMFCNSDGRILLGSRCKVYAYKTVKTWMPLGSMNTNGTINGASANGKGIGWVTKDDLKSMYSKTYNQILTGDNKGIVQVWDIQTGSNGATTVTKYALDPEGRYLFSCAIDGSCKVRHAFNGELVASLHRSNDESTTGEPTDCAFGELHSKYFFIVSSSIHCVLGIAIDNKFTKQTQNIPRKFTMQSNSAMITSIQHQVRRQKYPKHNLHYNLVTVDLSGNLILWNAIEMSKINTVETDDAINCVECVPGGCNEIIMIGYANGYLMVLHASKNGIPLFKMYIGVSLDRIAAESSKEKKKAEC